MISTDPLQLTPYDIALLFCELQGKRTSVFKDFDQGFLLFINKEATESQFKQLVQIVTKHFVSISNEEAMNLLEDKSHTVAKHIQKIQELEKSKLKYTVEYQTLQTETIFGDRDMENESSQAKLKITELIESINEEMEALHCFMADEL
ncbi:hypothetical protein BC833DRAFT_122497 [Globomyces pollinis-pini]|nr:hypothetical protein BC833DRAFT_122497 [Globomyces pollinis-pini]